jgi:serine/threonine protein phosphatase 1
MPPAERPLLHRLFRPKVQAEAPAAPPETVIYAIGDVHGRADLLHALLRKIALDAARHEPNSMRELILLGDYVDRGSDSRGVLDLILSTMAERSFWTVTPLKGNHEEALLQFLRDPSNWPTWSEFGARETLLSYGVAPPRLASDPQGWEAARQALAEAIPAEHMALYETLDLCASRGDYFFVHAGVRPNVPLDRQSEQDMLWIRDEFLRHERPLEKVIVHGHTPGEAYVGRHRIGLDTGAYATGLLTAIKLKGDERTLIQARAGEAEPA